MRDGYITIREHVQRLKLCGSVSFMGGGLFIALVNAGLAYVGVSL